MVGITSLSCPTLLCVAKGALGYFVGHVDSCSSFKICFKGEQVKMSIGIAFCKTSGLIHFVQNSRT